MEARGVRARAAPRGRAPIARHDTRVYVRVFSRAKTAFGARFGARLVVNLKSGKILHFCVPGLAQSAVFVQKTYVSVSNFCKFANFGTFL